MIMKSNRKDSPINRIQNARIEFFIEETNRALKLMEENITEDIETYIPIKIKKNIERKNDKNG